MRTCSANKEWAKVHTLWPLGQLRAVCTERESRLDEWSRVLVEDGGALHAMIQTTDYRFELSTVHVAAINYRFDSRRQKNVISHPIPTVIKQ